MQVEATRTHVPLEHMSHMFVSSKAVGNDRGREIDRANHLMHAQGINYHLLNNEGKKTQKCLPLQLAETEFKPLYETFPELYENAVAKQFETNSSFFTKFPKKFQNTLVKRYIDKSLVGEKSVGDKGQSHD
jgi:hypothetical protein